VISWEDLTIQQVDLLDSYLVERDLEAEHRNAGRAILGKLAVQLNMASTSTLAELADRRAEWIDTNPYSRAVVDKSVDEAGWLEARRRGVTATEIAKLAQGQPAARATILAEKLTGERSFFGNKYTDHGLEREPHISARLQAQHGFTPSDVLFHAQNDFRHLATPDGILVDGSGLVTIAEIKTGKHDLDPIGPAFAKTTYMDQMQWQMYVMGDTCTRCLFAWEQHDDEWVRGLDGVERPRPLGLEQAWVYRDDERIAELVRVADEFLADLDWAVL
jgi:hypothetical protein